MKVITLRQPWAHLVVMGHKTVENRSWSTDVRGKIGIHAAKSMDREAYATARAICRRLKIDLPELEALPFGALVGDVQLVDVTTEHASPWAEVGSLHWVLEGAHAYPVPMPCSGKLGFFEVPLRVLEARG
jgi:hypothetical protein